MAVAPCFDPIIVPGTFPGTFPGIYWYFTFSLMEVILLVQVSCVRLNNTVNIKCRIILWKFFFNRYIQIISVHDVTITKSRSAAPVKISMTAFKELENTILKLLWKHKHPAQSELLNWTIADRAITVANFSALLRAIWPRHGAAHSQTGGSVSLPHTWSSLQKHRIRVPKNIEPL